MKKCNHSYQSIYCKPEASFSPNRNVSFDCTKSGSRVKRNSPILDLMSSSFEETLPIWEDLTPSVLKCAGSVAGCDYCLYFASTYNISVSPAACIGGCSLGTFGKK